MSDILKDGIESLCKNDEDIAKLFAPRKEEIISLLTRYINEIEFFNKAYGLVGVESTEELIIKHILDSLAPVGIIYRLLQTRSEFQDDDKYNISNDCIADAGSGAGLPGIPLAIALPQFDFTLIERMGRRAGFLLNTKAALSAGSHPLSNVTIEENQLENTQSSRFNLVTFRAFKPLDSKLLKTLCRICVKDGIIAAYKGRLEKIEAEMAELPLLDGKWEAIPYSVPFLDEKRHILIISHINSAIK